MQFKGKIGTVPAEILVDSGAGVNIVSQSFAQKAGLLVNEAPSDIQVSMPDGESSSVVGTCNMRVKIQAYQCLVMCYVIPLADHCDAILGEPWLLRHSAYLDYENRCTVLRKGCKRIKLSCERPSQKLQAEHSKPAASLVLSAVQARKAVSKGEGAIVLLVTQSGKSESVHVSAVTNDDKSFQQQSQTDHTLIPQSDMQSILREYQDCFPESLPDGLPPERDVAHTIPTEPGVPPFKPMYRLSPKENAEVKCQVAEGLRQQIIESTVSLGFLK